MQKKKYEDAKMLWPKGKEKAQEAEAQRLRAKERREQEEYDEDQHYKPQRPNKKRSEICKFYGKGRCNKGSECRFRHIEEDFGYKT